LCCYLNFKFGLFQTQIFQKKFALFAPKNSNNLQIQDAASGIIAADSITKQDALKHWVEERKPSVYAENLKQLDNGVKVPPKGWKCAHCDLTENLWMNLTDGTILCGRKQPNGTGGNGHALEHFQKTGLPLCVKLGTITADASKAG
jgi:ubiquitin carboxyl-terminal hydrolase 5/13